ncbi:MULTISPECIES: carboxymuconolactone decarboxylase family protein [unclassified Caulobacter]|uniref:carboxymuconolactone decarboxylase family protein n=1 Tax=unclassified Caulobacter TaxID=2648921 RepID=UPI0004A73BB7|nr:carboxymuconolactone decarboxylase family protein [Caulobacter sp. UNC358MFTsu5.1]
MTPRFAPFKIVPDLTNALIAVEKALGAAGIEHGLAELVKIRASQINGCAFCVHMHVTDAKAHGETDMRLFLLDTWRESPLFTDRERAALAWTESLTRIAKTGAPDADYELVKSQFTEVEIATLSVIIGQINTWNRLQVAARAVHPVQPATVAA